mmetsp:Transcript_12090/g.50615  ORF Transcript_12090/g.50615 Transcript_12090/m.50615 type:complete len:301 (+) Transcript_12090:1-903(+)
MWRTSVVQNLGEDIFCTIPHVFLVSIYGYLVRHVSIFCFDCASDTAKTNRAFLPEHAREPPPSPRVPLLRLRRVARHRVHARKRAQLQARLARHVGRLVVQHAGFAIQRGDSEPLRGDHRDVSPRVDFGHERRRREAPVERVPDAPRPARPLADPAALQRAVQQKARVSPEAQSARRLGVNVRHGSAVVDELDDWFLPRANVEDAHGAILRAHRHEALRAEQLRARGDRGGRRRQPTQKRRSHGTRAGRGTSVFPASEIHQTRRPILHAVRDARFVQRGDARGEVLVPRRVVVGHGLELT